MFTSTVRKLTPRNLFSFLLSWYVKYNRLLIASPNYKPPAVFLESSIVDIGIQEVFRNNMIKHKILYFVCRL